MKYLVIECNELGDQYECDADRVPICVLDDYSDYNKMGYEIYEIHDDGSLTKIREYEDVNDTYISYCEYNADDDFPDMPLKIVRLKDGDRNAVNKSDIRLWKSRFHFSESISDITVDFESCGEHGEMVNGKWCVIGVTYDENYPRGC